MIRIRLDQALGRVGVGDHEHHPLVKQSSPSERLKRSVVKNRIGGVDDYGRA